MSNIDGKKERSGITSPNAFSLLVSSIQPAPSKDEIKVLSPLDEANDANLAVKTNLRY
jgi:hypothetical protein